MSTNIFPDSKITAAAAISISLTTERTEERQLSIGNSNGYPDALILILTSGDN